MSSVAVGSRTYHMVGDFGTLQNGQQGEVVNVFLHSLESNRKIECLPVINLISLDAAVGSFSQVYLALA